MSRIRVGIFGIEGKMGSEVRKAAGATDDLEVIGGVDLGGQREQIAAAQVAVDFTHPDAVMGNIEWCVPRGISMVIGTTGFTQERIARVRELCSASPGTGVLVASNFSIGAVLMMQFAAKAAPFYPSAEIIELHHPNKADVGHLSDHRWEDRRCPCHCWHGAGTGRDGARCRGSRSCCRRHPHPWCPASGARRPPGGAAGRQRGDSHDPA